jgi:hypothetical protein
MSAARKLCLPLVVLVVAAALSVPAFAGSQQGYTGTIDAGGIDFTATLIMNSSNDTFTLTFSGMNTNSTTSTLNAFALQTFCCGSNGTFSLTNSSLPLNWTDMAGAKIDNSGGLGCNASNGAAGWLCGTAQSNSDVLLIGSHQTFNMTFSGTYGSNTSVNSMFDLMANGLTNSGNDHSKWAVSQTFDWTEFTPVPEPKTLAIMTSSLLIFGGLMGKRLFQ